MEPIKRALQMTLNGENATVDISKEDLDEANQSAGQGARAILGDEWDAKNPTAEGIERIKDVLSTMQKRERDRLRIKYRTEAFEE